METCKIQWVDDDNNPTPDNHPAIGHVFMPERVWQIQGSGVRLDRTRDYAICAEHAKRLSEPGMHIWTFIPLT